MELVNCSAQTPVSLNGCSLVYWDRYVYRNLSGTVQPWHFYLISHINGSLTAQADDHFWISFSRDHTASVSVECEAGPVGRISWYHLGGLNFTLLDGETYQVTAETVPGRNSEVSASGY